VCDVATATREKQQSSQKSVTTTQKKCLGGGTKKGKQLGIIQGKRGGIGKSLEQAVGHDKRLWETTKNSRCIS